METKNVFMQRMSYTLNVNDVQGAIKYVETSLNTETIDNTVETEIIDSDVEGG